MVRPALILLALVTAPAAADLDIYFRESRLDAGGQHWDYFSYGPFSPHPSHLSDISPTYGAARFTGTPVPSSSYFRVFFDIPESSPFSISGFLIAAGGAGSTFELQGQHQGILLSFTGTPSGVPFSAVLQLIPDDYRILSAGSNLSGGSFTTSWTMTAPSPGTLPVVSLLLLAPRRRPTAR